MTDPVDVVVVGSGPSGAIVSLILAEAGASVVCLEQGDWTRPADHPHSLEDWEWQRLNRWSPDPNTRGGAHDYPVQSATDDPLMWNAVGGSTNVYTAQWPRLKPSEFRKGTEHGLAPDWPLTYEDLAPFYDLSDRLLGVSSLAGDPAMPPMSDYPMPPLPFRPFGPAVTQGFDRLGWHWWPTPCAINSRPYDGRPACNNCSNCPSGCPRAAMMDASTALWPHALKAGAALRPLSRVQEITVDGAGRATGVAYVDRASGERRHKPAGLVVVACNGVGTPRLLLMSCSGRFPNGLANGSDQVGRNLMHHTLVASEIWIDAPIQSHMGPTGALLSREFSETDPMRGFVNGFNILVVRSSGAGSATLGSFYNSKVAPWGDGHAAWFQRHFGHGFCAFAMGDDLPQPDNRVTLSDDVVDADGLPAPHVRYHPHENDRRMMGYAGERLREFAAALGAFDLVVNDYMDSDVYKTRAWHLMGTCRMGDDPADSVTTKWHQSWDVPNLYVVDGSSMPTGGASNPTTTICALALRAAHHLRDNLAELKRADRPVT